jgi:hypothetical protein
MVEGQDFVGRVVNVWAKEPACGGTLENVRVRRLGDRTFIVGELVDTGRPDSRVGCTFWFAVDDLLMLTEFPDVEAAKRHFAEWEERNREKQERDNGSDTRWRPRGYLG